MVLVPQSVKALMVAVPGTPRIWTGYVAKWSKQSFCPLSNYNERDSYLTVHIQLYYDDL